MTKIDNTFKSKVFKTAGKIFAKGKLSWSKSLVKAWAWAKKTLLKPQAFIKGQIQKETAKAVALTTEIYCHVKGVTAAVVWLPKTQILEIRQDGVAVTDWIYNAKSHELSNYGRSFF
jgi:hypothetical protein